MFEALLGADRFRGAILEAKYRITRIPYQVKPRPDLNPVQPATVPGAVWYTKCRGADVVTRGKEERFP